MKTERLNEQPRTGGIVDLPPAQIFPRDDGCFIPLRRSSLGTIRVNSIEQRQAEAIRELRHENVELHRALHQTRIGWAITCLVVGFFLWWSLGWQR